MTDDSRAGSDDTAIGKEEIPQSGPPEKMSPAFYSALALIGILVLMVIILNYPAAQANAGVMMARTTWALQSYRDATGIHIPAQSGTNITATFGSEGRLSGYAGCNGYTAAYQTREYSITITGTSSTKILCNGPGVMNQESAFLADLSRAVSFRVSESFLKFYDAAGKTILVFVPA
jgi:heat shock protein HslJ